LTKDGINNTNMVESLFTNHPQNPSININQPNTMKHSNSSSNSTPKKSGIIEKDKKLFNFLLESHADD